MFNPNLAIGQIITEKQIHELFACQTTLGIRMSKKNNLFVIMSGSAKRQKYNDTWIGDTLYYNGTDINSDQSTNQTLAKGRGNNNSQLRNVWFEPQETKPEIFLFVKFVSNQCIYKGKVQLKEEPYMQPSHDNPDRKVWIFPLQLMNIDEKENESSFRSAEEIAYEMSIENLSHKIEEHEKSLIDEKKVTKKYRVNTAFYERNPDLSAYVKLRADGICDLCGNHGPFLDAHNRPFLEEHHVKWLSQGGLDSLCNTVALCPNCHRKMHIINSSQDVELLKKKIEEYNSKHA